MKNKVFIVVVILILLSINPLKVSAQVSTPTPTPTITPVVAETVTVVDNKASVTFAQLRFRDDTLTSPLDSTRVLFSLPPNWRLVSGGEVEINYDVLFSGPDVAKIFDGMNPFGGSLSVVYNQQIIGNIPLDKAGSHTIRFQIPPEALNSAREDGRHQLTIFLDAQFSCTYDIRASVVIKSTSSFNLPFEISPPVLDLSKLPAPFYLQNALIPDRTLLVIPDEPSLDELRAALNIMAGFGSLVGTDFKFEIVNIGSLSNEDLASSNLIFAGKPNQLPLLAKVYFPTSVVNGEFVNLPAASANDGVLEMAISPWNQNKVVLLVSGNSDEAVSKAATAVSSGKIFIYNDPAVSYVSDVKLLNDAIPVVEDFNFKNLGYTTQTISGIGLISAEYAFDAAKEQVATKDGYFDLAFYNSGLLDYGASSLTVSLNDQIINGTAFSKETEKLTTLRIDIPTGLIRYGQNRLMVSSRMLTSISCDTTGFSNPWLVVSDQSKIHLPATAMETSLGRSILDLKSYPSLFLTHSDLGDVAFILPKSAPDSLRIAGKLAYDYGKTVTPLIPNLAAAYADDIPDEIRNGRSLIVIGKANALPLLTEINDRLPAPFNLDDNTASEGNMQVTYRIPAGVSVGYVELLYSPYNFEKTMLIVSGNTDEGLVMAGNALLQADLKNQLAGLFAITNGTQVASNSAVQNFSAVGKIVPNAEPAINTPILPRRGTNDKLPSPGWLIPLIVISASIIVLVLGYIIGSAILRRRSSKTVDVFAEKGRVD
jgi:hypothetical protein